MKDGKSSFSVKEKDKMKKKEKRIAIALATGIIVGNFPATLTYAETDIINRLNSELGVNINKNAIANNNIRTDNDLTVDETTVQEVATVELKDGRKIRAVKNNKEEIILQELNSNSQWIDRDTLGNVEIKEMIATDDGGYAVVYLDYKKADSFKYKQAYDKNHNKIGTEEIVGVEIETEDLDILLLDLVVDKNNNRTTIKLPLEEVTVEEFVPTLCNYIGSKHIVMIGEDSKGKTSILIVTGNGKVINGDIIKDSQYLSSEYTEIRSLGISFAEGEKFIVSGYAIKDTEPDKKDGFLIQFDEEGNKDSEVRIIPSSYGENGDASINRVMKFESGNMFIRGENLYGMYIKPFNYVDTRPIKESLTLLDGKSYKVVKETNKLRTASTDTNTFTVKSVNDITEYDIATYKDVQDIKLIPGNNNQVIIAVSNMDESTDVNIINTDDDAEFNSDGEVFGKVVNAGKIQDSNGPIHNIDIKNIKVNSDGNLSVTKINESAPIEVKVDKVEAGTPIDVIKEDPVIEIQTLYFDANNPKDIVIKDVHFKGSTLTHLGIGGEIIDINTVITTDNSIIIPKEILQGLQFDNGIYSVALGFSNGSLFVGFVNVHIEVNQFIEKQNLSFDRNNPQDVVIKNVDFKGLKLEAISVGGKHIDISTVTTTDNSIIIPKELFINLQLNNGKYYMTLQFDNGSISFEDVTVDITGDLTPTISEQILSFDRNNPEDVVVKNVDFKGISLKYIYINGKSIPVTSLNIEDDKISIPANVLESLGLIKGTYDISFKFSNETTILTTVYLNVIDTGNEVTPPVEEEKPEDKPEITPPVEEEKPEEKPEVTPPAEEEKPEDKPEIIPPVEEEKPEDKPEVTPPGEEEKPEDKPEVTPPAEEEKPEEKPEVTPPAEEEKPEDKPEVIPPVEEEKPEERPEVRPPVEEEKPEEKPEVTPPVENSQIVNADNGEKIVFDITKPTNIKIISSKLENKDIEYILVNGIKVTRTTIERELARAISEYSIKEYFTTSNGSITLSAKLFEDLNLDIKEGYNIGVGFADGSEIADLVKLSIVDSSMNTDNIVTPPAGDSENNSNNGNTSNDGSNSTTNNVEQTNKLPNTGSPISSGAVSIFGILSAFVGTRLLKKKK